jgi:mycothiol synthase
MTPAFIRTAPLPTGYTARHVTLDDLQMVCDFLNVMSQFTLGRDAFTPTDIRIEWTSGSIILETSTQLIFDRTGALVAYMEIWMMPINRSFIWSQVHPQHEKLGIGTYLLEYAEEAVRQSLATSPTEGEVVIMAGHHNGMDAAQDLFTHYGMTPTRWFHRMGVVLTEPPAPAIFPQGIRVRSYQHPQDLRATVRAKLDAFADHWGFVEPNFETEMEEWANEVENDPLFDASLWLLAVDEATQEIAGVVLNRNPAYDDAEAGFIAVLAVRRAYRRHGLGSALIQLSMQKLFEVGKRKIVLNVDAHNPTGALGIYEKVGMEVLYTRTIYEKVIQPATEELVFNKE